MAITQQQECYAAEAQLGSGRVFNSVEEVQQFVDSLRDTPWWRGQQYDRHVMRVEVGAARSGTTSVGWYDKDKGAGRIELAAGSLDVKTALHEVAHVIAIAAHGSKSHDPWWARVYLTLVSCVMGPEAYLTLQQAFDAKGVDYTVDLTPAGVIAL